MLNNYSYFYFLKELETMIELICLNNAFMIQWDTRAH